MCLAGFEWVLGLENGRWLGIAVGLFEFVMGRCLPWVLELVGGCLGFGFDWFSRIMPLLLYCERFWFILGIMD